MPNLAPYVANSKCFREIGKQNSIKSERYWEMNSDFDPKPLCAAYDSGRLVPFIGSGMSIPACVSWKEFVERLEAQCITGRQTAPGKDLVQRAFFAMQSLLLNGTVVAEAIQEAVYSKCIGKFPEQTKVLASMFWPLICTTNYDDLYVRAKYNWLKQRNAKMSIRVVGRSDADCYHVLQHLNFPASEVVWALQGFLKPREMCVTKALGSTYDGDQLERELVVGHAEYRRAAHRTPYFRRCFAVMFQRSSLLFLGSGLEEPYFLSLFDEIIELTGPPATPHFAIVEEGKVDLELMRRQYHIVCMTYPKNKHECVAKYLTEFSNFTRESRVRPSSWGYRLSSPQHVGWCDSNDQFRVVRGVLPKPEELPCGEAIGISCGRQETPCDPRGRPLVNPNFTNWITPDYEWLNDWTLRSKARENVYGIVARELPGNGESSRDRRSAEAIRMSFLNSLKQAEMDRFRVLHVQLLGAGPGKVFHPWVSLTQMARAYGQWFRKRLRNRKHEPVCVELYVVDPAVIALLQGSFIDLVEQLQDAPLHIDIEIIDSSGNVDRHHQLINANAELFNLVPNVQSSCENIGPKISARPKPSPDHEPIGFCDVKNWTVREFGLVSGSTLVLDYRKE